MRRLFIFMLGITCVSILHAASPPENSRDPYFREALYHAHQGHFFNAIARLDTELGQFYELDEPELDSLFSHIGSAEFSVGDFELSYRMHNRAGRAINAVIEGDVPEAVRNTAAYRLARIYFQKDQAVNALHALQRIEGSVPEPIRDDVEFLRAHIYMKVGRFSDAITTLESLGGTGDLQGFVAYNLGIALAGAGQENEAFAQLDKAGQSKSEKPGGLAIRDKSNLVVGTRYLEEEQAEQASKYLDRVRLEGPFSNRALLGSGWAKASEGRFERALVPWSILVQRNSTDNAVQEAILALPYAYGKLELHGKAALAYGRALDVFGGELDKLNASIKSIRAGKFLEAMVREEVTKDKNWVVKLRDLPETPETYYLIELMASHDFQASLQNYLDLVDLRKRLVAWEGSLDAYEDVISLRRRYYEPLLPQIDEQFRRLDAQMRLRVEQRNHLNNRLQAMLVSPRPSFLARTDERVISEGIARIESEVASSSTGESSAMLARTARLKGVLTWRLATEYDERLTEAHEHLHELDTVIAQLQKQYDAFVRTRQAARQSYDGYEASLQQLRAKRAREHQRVKTLIARQGHMLEILAVDELERRRQRLEEYQVKARFALADSYDRAGKAEIEARTERIQESTGREKSAAEPDNTSQVETRERGEQELSGSAQESSTTRTPAAANTEGETE